MEACHPQSYISNNECKINCVMHLSTCMKTLRISYLKDAHLGHPMIRDSCVGKVQKIVSYNIVCVTGLSKTRSASWASRAEDDTEWINCHLKGHSFPCATIMLPKDQHRWVFFKVFFSNCLRLWDLHFPVLILKSCFDTICIIKSAI